MTYIPLTEQERAAMLKAIGVEKVEHLFEDIPEQVRYPTIQLPEALSELEALRELQGLSEENLDLNHALCFLGAGAYWHFIPSVVDQLAGRSEFYTAYTPYQPEISQGTLQAIFEYQTMICELTGMEVANASHYDGATSLAEGVLMAYQIGRGKRNKVVLSSAIHPEYRQVVHTYVQGMDIEVVGAQEAPDYDLTPLIDQIDDDTACVAIQHPDFLGRLYALDELKRLAEAAHAHGALLIVVGYPIALGLIHPPGAYDADVAVGEGQPLGIPLSYGGPYLGYFATRRKFVHKMAGRLVGETVDREGRRGYVLTLSAREQHIRRERATSNICSNQALCALRATIYMATLGRNGLRKVAELCYHKAHYLADQIDALPTYSVQRDAPFFNEFIVQCPRPVREINHDLLEWGIIGGYDLGQAYPGWENRMLLCATEMHTRRDLDTLVQALEEVGS